MSKNKLKCIAQPEFHFYASSFATWVTGTDPEALLKRIRKEDGNRLNHSLWYIPLPENRDVRTNGRGCNTLRDIRIRVVPKPPSPHTEVGVIPVTYRRDALAFVASDTSYVWACGLSVSLRLRLLLWKSIT